MSVTSTSHSCSLIAPALHEQIENLRPRRRPRARARTAGLQSHGHLITMPTRRWPRPSTAKFSGEQWLELENPSPHRFVGDIQTALREQIFDVAIAERKRTQSQTVCRMIAGGNWWQANEIVMRHLTGQTNARDRSHDKTRQTAAQRAAV